MATTPAMQIEPDDVGDHLGRRGSHLDRTWRPCGEELEKPVDLGVDDQDRTDLLTELQRPIE